MAPRMVMMAAAFWCVLSSRSNHHRLRLRRSLLLRRPVDLLAQVDPVDLLARVDPVDLLARVDPQAQREAPKVE